MTAKLCFMHIAKTAGSSVNLYFQPLFGTEKCCLFAEHEVQNGVTVNGLMERYNFVSGHLFYGHFAIVPKDVYTLTVIREPYAHLASQLRWINHYNAPELYPELTAFPREIRDLIQFVGSFDLSSVHQLDELLTNLPPYGIYLFNNLQSRYLVGDPANMDPLSLRDAPFVMSHLATFSFCFTLDSLAVSLPAVSRALGFEERPFTYFSNEARGHSAIDLSSKLVRRVLQKHLLVDLLVYENVREIGSPKCCQLE